MTQIPNRKFSFKQKYSAVKRQAGKICSASPDIVISVTVSPAHVRIAITDQGSDIAANKTQHLFDRCYQAEEYSKQFSGFGLGLYIAAEIISNHSGTIGLGSTFFCQNNTANT